MSVKKAKEATTYTEPTLEPSSTACCGGPAPRASSACCALDAELEADGGCGCSSKPASATKKGCC